MSLNADKKLLEALEMAVGHTHATEAIKNLIDGWRYEEDQHSKKVFVLTGREKILRDKITAMTILLGELKYEVGENRSVLEGQMQALQARAFPGASQLGPEAEDFKRVARLLLTPGKKITDATLRALSLTPPSRNRRPSEHFVRQVATHVLPVLGFETIKSQSAHPDLICKYDGKVIGVEIEVSLQDYNAHGHDGADASVVACWITPERNILQDDLCFISKNCSNSFSPRLAVLPLQQNMIWGLISSVGNKRPLTLD